MMIDDVVIVRITFVWLDSGNHSEYGPCRACFFMVGVGVLCASLH